MRRQPSRHTGRAGPGVGKGDDLSLELLGLGPHRVVEVGPVETTAHVPEVGRRAPRAWAQVRGGKGARRGRSVHRAIERASLTARLSAAREQVELGQQVAASARRGFMPGVAHAQQRHDVIARGSCGRGRDCNDGHCRVAFLQLIQATIEGAEAVPPLADAVRLIDGEPPQPTQFLHVLQRLLQRGRLCKPLGRDVQEADGPRTSQVAQRRTRG